MASFFCPSRFEAPSFLHHKFNFFGMGAEAARDLGRKLSLTKPVGHIVVVGSAGALNKSYRVGDCFLVKELLVGDEFVPLNIPTELNFLPQARLVSFEKPVTRAREKHEIFQASAADLADCEMVHLWEQLPEEVRDRVIFIRGVVDDAKTNINFLEGFEVKWLRLLNPFYLVQFLGFLFSYLRYRSALNDFFKRVVQIAILDESTMRGQVD